MLNAKAWRWLECLALFIVTPALFGFNLVSTPLILLPLLLICVPAAIWLGRTQGVTSAVFWQGEPVRERKYLPFLLYRFLVVAPLLLGIASITMPQQLFDLPRNAPVIWLLFIVGYPLLSVYPQELLFRAFFFSRYKCLFNSERMMLGMNALLFGWMHVAFANVTAVVLSLIGGWFFATTYRNTRSLRLVCLEHGLYGVLIFTIGYGRLFLFEKSLLVS